MDTEIHVKRVKLEVSDEDALIKSKWTETTIAFEILMCEKNGENLQFIFPNQMLNYS